MSNGKLQRLPYYAGLYSRLFKKILGTRIAARFLNGVSPYLNFVIFNLTWRCNMRCIMCSLYGQTGVKKKFTPSSLRREEMNLDEWKKLVDDLVPFIPTIQLFGGEPLLYEGAIELIKYIKKRGLRCQMVTNGTLLKNKAEAIIESGLDELWISIDGPEEIHNKIRGVTSFKKILDGIAFISDLKTKLNVRGPTIRIICTIFDINYLYLEELIRSLEGLNIYSISFSHVQFTSSEIVAKHNSMFQNKFRMDARVWSGYVLDVNKMDVNLFIEKVNRIKTRSYHCRIDFDPDFSPTETKEYYTNFHISFRKNCIAPWLTAIITPEGNVNTCSAGYLIGNVKKESFKYIWNGKQGVKFRQVLREVNKFPACDRCLRIHKYAFRTFSKEIIHGVKDFLRN